ncbi:hypothetical protein [Salinispora sp. H7-4]|uniref:hypothetical protein n=1 Tax=Salinispora sp. H7-4 TaxID=2748321 RepID=UPI0015D27E76|nr:hypothetical protein [Salinispora sp. H7-4]NYT95242.1 hypothetical protein [Salinispora sp. H7-4]
MKTATKLTAFLLGLAVVFGVAYGVGQVTGPGSPAVETHHDDPGHANPEHDAPEHDDPGAGSHPPARGPDR